MLTRREAITLLGALTAGAPDAMDALRRVAQRAPSPTLAPGAPMSPERVALIDAFRARSAGLDARFEARTQVSDWAMPYRLFRPNATGRVPLVVYLHGSGGLGGDNQKQMGLGNVFGTRVWALPDNQRRFPCYVLAPQTDRGWIRYGDPSPGDSVARPVPGLGDGARLVLAIIDRLRRELPIDERRIYITGQSMGGAGAWHLTAHRPRLFAAAAICCGSPTLESAADSRSTPLWNFQGDADQTVAPSVSRARVAALRKAGGDPIATEYAGVGHNVWQWAYTEPALPEWLFAHRAST
jgi:predicted peptidase